MNTDNLKINSIKNSLKELCKNLVLSFSQANISLFRLEKDKLSSEEIHQVIAEYNKFTHLKVDSGAVSQQFLSNSDCKDGVDVAVLLAQSYGYDGEGIDLYAEIKKILINESAKSMVTKFGGLALNE